MDEYQRFLSPRTLADMEVDVIRRGGSFDVDMPERAKPRNPRKKKEGR